MRMTEEEYEAIMKKRGKGKKPTRFTSQMYGSQPQKKSKMNNKKGEMDGYKFDSKKEMKRYNQLKILQRAGQIQNLQLQPVYVLQESYRKDGKFIHKIKYLADFQYEMDGKVIVEDVKPAQNFTTPMFKLKKKMFEYKYPELSITEVYEV